MSAEEMEPERAMFSSGRKEGPRKKVGSGSQNPQTTEHQPILRLGGGRL